MANGLSACEALSPLFDAERRPGDFAETIDRPPGSFRCELEQVSARSRGRPVADDEILARVIIAPRDLKVDGPFGLGDTAVSEMCRLGLSTLRIDEIDFALKIERLAQSLIRKAAEATPIGEEVFCAGVLEFTCAIVRNFRVPSIDKRIIGAYESPEEDYPNHSDVLQAVNLFSSKTKSKLAAKDFLARGNLDYYPADDYPRANLRNLRMAGSRVIAV